MSKLFNFSEPLTTPHPAQLSQQTFGPQSSDHFRVTSSFSQSGKKAYAMMKGTILFFQQADSSKVNIVLRPSDPGNFKVPIKYVIYRGFDTLNYISSETLTDPTNKVQTTGNGLLLKMQEIQALRAPGDDVPVTALFGYDLSAAGTSPVGSFFFQKTLVPTSLFTVNEGVELGEYSGDVTIEMVLENPDFDLTVAMAKEDILELDVSPLSISDKKTARENARHFIDPVAFFGLHHAIKGGIGYVDVNYAVQTASTKSEVYEQIQAPFFTRSRVYLDIRNEHGYSYNYYNGYTGTSGNSINDAKELKIGDNSSTLALKEYYTSEWPIHIVDVITPDTSAAFNTFHLELRINENQRPLLATDHADISPVTIEDSGIRFLDETALLPSPIPAVLPEFTNTVTIKVPNIPGSTGVQPAMYLQLNYYLQVLSIDSSAMFPVIHFSDYLFGPVNTVIPFDSGNNIQWITSNKRSLIDAVSDGYVKGQMKTPILSLVTGTREIEIFDEVPVDTAISVTIENDNANPANEGTYTVESFSVLGGTTTIVVREALPGALQSGDSLVLSVVADGKMDYAKNAFTIKNHNYSVIGAFITGSRLDLYSKYQFASSYTIDSVAFTTPDTVVVFEETVKKEGYAGIIETGLILETDLATGSPTDDDRLMYYAAPIGYFQRKGVKRGFSSFANKGGSSELKSILDLLKRMMPGVDVSEINLKPFSSTTNILAFEYVQNAKAKQLLFLLGITKTEYTGFNLTAFSNAHMVLIRLISGARNSDQNGTVYFQYEIQLVGMNSSQTYHEENTGVFVYSTDNLIFTSEAFAARYGIDEAAVELALDQFIDFYQFTNLKNYTFEEKNVLDINSSGAKSKVIIARDPSMVTKVLEFRLALDTVPDTSEDIEALLKLKGAELFAHAKNQIKLTAQLFTNKDAILYIARLRMQVILRNHPLIVSKGKKRIKELYKLFELHSRGLAGAEKPDFSGVPSGVKRILISGFDPFQGGVDWQQEISNPSGNIALAMGDVDLLEGGTNALKAVVKSVVFPVRWEDFDEAIAEDFFEPYFAGGEVDMVITYSYGLHYDPSVPHDFHLERFASNWQTYSGENNGTKNYDGTERRNQTPDYIKRLNAGEDDLTFIESTLPFHKLEDSLHPGFIKVGTTNKAVVNHGGFPTDNTYNQWFNWAVFGKNNTTNKVEEITDLVKNVSNEPSALFGSQPFEDDPFMNLDYRHFSLAKAYFRGVYLVCDNTTMKYFYPKPPVANPHYIPLPTWSNYTIPGFGTTHSNIKIEARNGSGGDYLSNMIFYRVAYMRMKHGNTVPSGHIHMGFNKNMDPHTDRSSMLADVLEILQKFNDITP